MFFLIPFTYLILCVFTAFVLYRTYKGSFVFFVVLGAAITPFLLFIISILFPRRPVAYCMIPYKNFEVGRGYAFRIKNRKNDRQIIVYHDKNYTLSEPTFNNYFSAVDKSTEPRKTLFFTR